MELDFSRLNALSGLSDGHTEELKALADNLPTDAEKSQNRASERPLQDIKLQQAQDERELARRVYKEYQEAIKKSEAVRCEILLELKGMASGAQPKGDGYSMLSKCLELIGELTGDKGLYSGCEEYLKQIM